MKKLMLSLMLIVFLLIPMGGTAVAEGGQPSEYTPGGVPAETALQEAMLPPIHALVLAMVENELDYDADSDLFVWSGLYYMLSLYGQMDDRAQLTDETLILPSETVRDYIAPLFPGLTQLPQLPAELSDRITYRAEDDVYLLARGDMGLASVELDGSYPAKDGGRVMTGSLIYQETGETICRFEASLSSSDSMFGHAVSGLAIL